MVVLISKYNLKWPLRSHETSPHFERYVNSLWPNDAICDIHLGQHWLMQSCLVACWHEAIRWTKFDLSSVRSRHNHKMVISQETLQASITKISLRITFLKFCPKGQWVNSLGSSDDICQQRSGSTLAQVMACCLMAPSHHLNLCWLNICHVLCHSQEVGKISIHDMPLKLLLSHYNRMSQGPMS